MAGADDDISLLDAWRRGDGAAGAALFGRHFESIYRFFDRKVQSDVTDLVQRTFLSCVEGRDRFRGEASVRTYLFAIARHELYGYWRERKRDAGLDFAVSSLHDLGPSPESVVARGEKDRLLLEALRRMPLDLQIAIELHYWEGLSGPEVAVVLDVPEGTVRSRLRRGLELLRAEVTRLVESERVLGETLSDLDRWAEALGDAPADGK